MITRSKLVEQLRDYQIRSQNKFPALIFFSPKPHITSGTDVAVAIFWAVAFIVLATLSYFSLYFRHFWLSFITICLGIFLPMRLRSCRQALLKKRERKFLLPLSIFHTAMAHGPLRYHFVLLILNTVQGSDDDHEQRRKAKELKPSDGNG